MLSAKFFQAFWARIWFACNEGEPLFTFKGQKWPELLWCPLFICWRSSVTRFFLQGFFTNHLLTASPLNNFITHHFGFFEKSPKYLQFGKFTAKLALTLAGNLPLVLTITPFYLLQYRCRLHHWCNLSGKHLCEFSIKCEKHYQDYQRVRLRWFLKKTWRQKPVTLFL